ncbi:MAG TPA: alpha/beta hydrolase, partial [Gemmatimonadaceae bacterium]|nr:alpha/beta hydrolase [Gemmatimonadaceae bacterium]
MKTTIGSFARLKCALFALLGMFVVASSALAQQTASRRAGGRRAFVNGVNMYYLVQGTGGVPLILLHGAFSNIQTDFGKMLPTLSKNRQVIAIEQQGHGHTADIDRPLSY